VVVASEFEADSPNKISQRLQGMFAEGYQAEVVGKSLDEIDLDVVNGSSLTPKGFMDALDDIKAGAQQLGRLLWASRRTMSKLRLPWLRHGLAARWWALPATG
jgi:hypothetical protein